MSISKELEQMFKSTPEERAYWHFMFEITETLVVMRKGRGLSQRQLAKLMKTSHPTISQWESMGYDGYSVRKLYELAEQLGYRLEVSFTLKEAHHE